MKNQKEVDLYRDTYVRYLGYANEVGEAFRSLVPKSIVWFSYTVSSGYVLADTMHKGAKVYYADTNPQKSKNVILSTSDTLIWQTFASIIVPGFTINRICTVIQFAQRKSTSVIFRKPWISTLVGLVSIPFIIHPIDHAVERTMDVTYRKWTGYHPKAPLCGIKHEYAYNRRVRQREEEMIVFLCSRKHRHSFCPCSWNNSSEAAEKFHAICDIMSITGKDTGDFFHEDNGCIFL